MHAAQERERETEKEKVESTGAGVGTRYRDCRDRTHNLQLKPRTAYLQKSILY